MKCEECENYEHDEGMENAMSNPIDCQNYKPKLHPLDEIMEVIKNMYEIAQLNVTSPLSSNMKLSDKPMDLMLKKLRSESIKYGAKLIETHGYCRLKAGLEKEGHEDWIVSK